MNGWIWNEIKSIKPANCRQFRNPDLTPQHHLFPPCSVQKVVLCSGKHYYALLKQREATASNQNTALIRVEELCPFPLEALQQEFNKYPNAKGMCQGLLSRYFTSVLS